MNANETTPQALADKEADSNEATGNNPLTRYWRAVSNPLIIVSRLIGSSIIGAAIFGAAVALLTGGDKTVLLAGLHFGMMIAAFATCYIQKRSLAGHLATPTRSTVARLHSVHGAVPHSPGTFLQHESLRAVDVVSNFAIRISLCRWQNRAAVSEQRDRAAWGRGLQHKQVSFFPTGLGVLLVHGIGFPAMLLVTGLLLSAAMTRTEVGAPLEELGISNVEVLNVEEDPYETDKAGRFRVVTFFRSSNNKSFDDFTKIDQWAETVSDESEFNFLLVDLSHNPERARAMLEEHEIETEFIPGYLEPGTWISTFPHHPATWVLDMDANACAAAAIRGNEIDQVLEYATRRFDKQVEN